MLGFLVAQTATAQQEGKAEGPKAGAAETKPAPEKAATKGKAPKAQPTVKKGEIKPLLDSHGKPIREQLVDSKGRAIPVREVPLKDAFLCYPPSAGTRYEKEPVTEPGKEKVSKELTAGDIPKEFICTPFQPEPHATIRAAKIPCPYTYYSCSTSGHSTACCCCRY